MLARSPHPRRAAAHRSGTGRLISHERADHFALRADTQDGRSYRSRELVVRAGQPELR